MIDITSHADLMVEINSDVAHSMHALLSPLTKTNIHISYCQYVVGIEGLVDALIAICDLQ